MALKHNQYRQAILAVEKSYRDNAEEVTKSYPSSKAESLASSVAGSSWKSPQAEKYAEDVRDIVGRLTGAWDSLGSVISETMAPERDKEMVDEDSNEGWKAYFLNMR